MTPQEMRHEIRRRAGVKSKIRMLPVRIVVTASGTMVPPTLRPKNRKTHQREVVVSASWLQKKAPKLWAAFVAARLLDTPDRMVITSLKEKE